MTNTNTSLLEYTVDRLRGNGMACEIHEANFLESIYNVIGYTKLL